MDFVLAYVAGLLTLLNPCVIPILPIVIATAFQASRYGPLAMAAGLCVTFVTLGVAVSAFGFLIGLDAWLLSKIGAGLMIFFGMALLLPRGAQLVEHATAGMAAHADTQMDTLDRSSLRGQFLGGCLLGVVWSPCIGPTLGSAIALASQGQNLGMAAGLMATFALGVSSLILGFSYGARGLIGKHSARLRALASTARPALGIAFAIVGFVILLDWHHLIEGAVLQIMPEWLVLLSVSV